LEGSAQQAIAGGIDGLVKSVAGAVGDGLIGPVAPAINSPGKAFVGSRRSGIRHGRDAIEGVVRVSAREGLVASGGPQIDIAIVGAALKPYVKSKTLPLGAASVHWK
jgi:hypothetical protein